MAGVEGLLLRGRPPRYVQLPTAAAQEGEQSLRRWLELGAAQAQRLGVEQVPVLVRNRAEADSAEMAALIGDAGLIYLSGGSPSYLAATLRGSKVWQAIVASWQAGAALAGCSAGAIALTGWVPSIRDPAREPVPGLGVLPGLRVIPHFDKMLAWIPDLADRAVAGRAPATTVIGIDEDTALVDMSGGGRAWEVHGRQQAWILGPGSRQGWPAGGVVSVLT